MKIDRLNTIIFPVIPVAKPRMTRRDKWSDRPVVMDYREYKGKLAIHYKECAKAEEMLLNYPTRITFFMPMPKSWSKKNKSKLLLTPHLQTPDIDNLLKGFLDAILDEDKSVWSVWCEKRWADLGRIQVNKIKV